MTRIAERVLELLIAIVLGCALAVLANDRNADWVADLGRIVLYGGLCALAILSLFPVCAPGDKRGGAMKR